MKCHVSLILVCSLFAKSTHLGAFSVKRLTVSLSLSHWYPGSGVVLDCIDS